MLGITKKSLYLLIKQQQNDKMKTTSIIIEKVTASDRCIIMFIKNGQIQGLNFYQGLDENFPTDFYCIDPQVTEFVQKEWQKSVWADHYEDMNFVHPSPDYWEILDCIDNILCKYVQKSFRKDEIVFEIEGLMKKVTELKKELTLLNFGI